MKAFFISILIILSVSCVIYAQATGEIIDYDKEDVRYIKTDIDKDGKVEEISVITGELESGQDVCILSVKDGRELITKALLIDFDHSCSLSLVEIWPNLEPFVGVGYGMGAHGYALTLFRYNKQQHILDRQTAFWSDKSSIQIKDVDADGVKEIVTILRDYESNSLEDVYIIVHKYIDDGRWRRVSVYKTATGEYMPDDWGKDEADIKAFKKNLKKFGLYEPADE